MNIRRSARFEDLSSPDATVLDIVAENASAIDAAVAVVAVPAVARDDPVAAAVGHIGLGAADVPAAAAALVAASLVAAELDAVADYFSAVVATAELVSADP